MLLLLLSSPLLRHQRIKPRRTKHPTQKHSPDPKPKNLTPHINRMPPQPPRNKQPQLNHMSQNQPPKNPRLNPPSEPCKPTPQDHLNNLPPVKPPPLTKTQKNDSHNRKLKSIQPFRPNELVHSNVRAAQGFNASLVHGDNALARFAIGFQRRLEGDAVVFLTGPRDEIHPCEVHGCQAAGARSPGGEGVVVFEVADDLMGKAMLVGEGQASTGVSFKSYGVVVVFLHVVYDPGLRGGVFACLVCHCDVGGVDDRGV